MLAEARRAAGLSQDELAERAGTSRPTLSSYEHGHRSPTLQTATRILAAAGFELTATPTITFTEQTTTRGRSVLVPSHLPRLDPVRALATGIQSGDTGRLCGPSRWSGPRGSLTAISRPPGSRYTLTVNAVERLGLDPPRRRS
jgi:transcriptional regulator with XRE-family HTH domain